MAEVTIEKLKGLIRDVPDFPKEGIMFKDITPLIGDKEGLTTTLDLLGQPFLESGVTAVCGMESRGFIFGVPVAERLGVGFVPVRKPGKLPAETISEEYALEYGTDSLEMHKDALTNRHGPEKFLPRLRPFFLIHTLNQNSTSTHVQSHFPHI